MPEDDDIEADREFTAMLSLTTETVGRSLEGNLTPVELVRWVYHSMAGSFYPATDAEKAAIVSTLVLYIFADMLDPESEIESLTPSELRRRVMDLPPIH